MEKKQKLKNHENILPTTELEANQKKKNIYILYGNLQQQSPHLLKSDCATCTLLCVQSMRRSYESGFMQMVRNKNKK